MIKRRENLSNAAAIVTIAVDSVIGKAIINSMMKKLEEAVFNLSDRKIRAGLIFSSAM